MTLGCTPKVSGDICGVVVLALNKTLPTTERHRHLAITDRQMSRVAVILLAGLLGSCTSNEVLSPENMVVTPTSVTAPQVATLTRSIDVVGAATGGSQLLPKEVIERAMAESLDAHGLLAPQGIFRDPPAHYNLALNIRNYRFSANVVRFQTEYILIDTGIEGPGRVHPTWTTEMEVSELIRQGEEVAHATERALRASLEEMLSRLRQQPPAT
jgi:hypothetical protein